MLFVECLFLFIFICALSKPTRSDGKETGQWRGTRKTENNIEYISNPKDPIFGEIELKLVEDLSIGNEEKEKEGFYKGVSIAIDNDENIYLLDMGSSEVRKFDRNGRFMLAFGNKGQGPGEWLAPSSIRFDTHKKEIAVFDMTQSRIVFFSSEGEFSRDVSLIHKLYLWEILPGGFIVANTISLTDRVRTADIMVINTTDSKSATIASYPQPPARLIDGALLGVYSSYAPILCLTRLDDDHIVYGHSSDYKFSICDSEGRTIKVIEREPEPEAISSSERDKDISRELDHWRTKGILLSKARVKNEYAFPPYKPLFYNLIADDLGNIYSLIKKTKVLSPQYDCFNSRGYYCYRIKTNPPVIIRLIRKEKIYSIEENHETGYLSIKRYKIVNWGVLSSSMNNISG